MDNYEEILKVLNILSQTQKKMIENQQKQIEIEDKILNLFLQYDKSYNEEMLKKYSVS
jgi:hypothetical protein